MSDKKEFYIGWQDKMPPNTRSFLRKVLLPLAILVPLIVLLIVFFQKPFNQHQFEFGNVRTFIGVYHASPVPLLTVSTGIPDSISSACLLVGYGKWGAEGIMKEIEKEAGPLDRKEITIRGSLIYGDGKALIELTEKEESLVSVGKQAPPSPTFAPQEKAVSLEGEILDPKCYFGVMKPGEGKIHKSCAIRCISGGIPPVFRSMQNGRYEYSILRGPNGESINEEVLPFVASTIRLEGIMTQEEGWNIIRTKKYGPPETDEP